MGNLAEIITKRSWYKPRILMRVTSEEVFSYPSIKAWKCIFWGERSAQYRNYKLHTRIFDFQPPIYILIIAYMHLIRQSFDWFLLLPLLILFNFLLRLFLFANSAPFFYLLFLL